MELKKNSRNCTNYYNHKNQEKIEINLVKCGESIMNGYQSENQNWKLVKQVNHNQKLH